MPLNMSNLVGSVPGECQEPLHPQALLGLELFNHGHYFEAHEALETAWRAETGPVRELYRGILQAAVVYLHITRHNYPGAIKVYQRCRKWLDLWPATCRGVAVGRLRRDLEAAVREVQALGRDHMAEFNHSLLKPVLYAKNRPSGPRPDQARVFICDRCGSKMIERSCKITCPNCGNRFDCSDLNLYYDELKPVRE